MYEIYEWTVAIICLAGTLVNIKKLRLCFILWGIGNVMWLAWDIANGVYSRAALDIVQLGCSIIGYRQWGKDC